MYVLKILVFIRENFCVSFYENLFFQDNDEITRSRCEAMNELMISLATSPYDCCSSSSGDEEFESYVLLINV